MRPRRYSAGPEHYSLNIASELLSADPEVNRRLHAAGFTQQQAQLFMTWPATG